VQSNVLLLSQRRIADLAAFCLAYEFEDTFAAVTDAQRIDATDLPALEFSRRAYKLARLAGGSPKLARQVVPFPRTKVLLEHDFELFFPVFNHTYELYSLATIPNWRQRCRKAACFISEVWSDALPQYLLELLSEFDHVFIGHCHRVLRLHCPINRALSRFAIWVGAPTSRIRRCSMTQNGGRASTTSTLWRRVART
jgi:hypothetical protein